MSSEIFPVLLPAFIYAGVLMLIGVPGNLLVIVVYVRRMTRTTSRHFIISLAVYDFLNCTFGMPVELTLLFNFYNFDYPIICKLSRFANFVMNNGSACVLICIAVDRFRRVCMPLKPNMTVTHSKILCTTFTVVSIICALPALFIYNTVSIPLQKLVNVSQPVLDLKTCYIDSTAGVSLPLAYNLYLFISIVLMILTLVIIYALIGRVISSQKKLSRPDRGHLSTMTSVDATTFRANTFKSRLLRSVSERSFLKASKSHSPIGTPETIPALGRRSPNIRSATPETPGTMRRHGGQAIRAGRTALVLFVVTLVFILSFMPYVVLGTLRFISPSTLHNLNSSQLTLYHFTLRSYLLNSAANPLIYCFLNRHFRQKAASLFKCKNSK